MLALPGLNWIILLYKEHLRAFKADPTQHIYLYPQQVHILFAM
jgi:hypothetical protein